MYVNFSDSPVPNMITKLPTNNVSYFVLICRWFLIINCVHLQSSKDPSCQI